MARPRGVRNPDFDEKRSRLIDSLAEFVLSTDLKRASLRQFAQAAGVSEPTLRHYFDDRTGVVRAVMKRVAEQFQAHLEHEDEPCGAYDACLQAQVDKTLAGLMSERLARAHAFGLIEGVAEPELGRAYLATLLEPTLRSIEARFQPFHGKEDTAISCGRAIALMLFGSLLLAGLHQGVLGGDAEEPMDMKQTFACWGEALARAFPASKAG